MNKLILQTLSNKCLLIFFMFLFFYATELLAAPKISAHQSIQGVWKLISVSDKNLLTGKKSLPYGDHPAGYLYYLPDGNMSVIIVSSERKSPNKQLTTQEAADLFNSMTSYSGTYTISGNKITHHISVAWNPLWTATEQHRYYTLKENKLILKMDWQLQSTAYQTVLVWEKVI